MDLYALILFFAFVRNCSGQVGLKEAADVAKVAKKLDCFAGTTKLNNLTREFQMKVMSNRKTTVIYAIDAHCVYAKTGFLVRIHPSPFLRPPPSCDYTFSNNIYVVRHDIHP